MSAAIVSLDDIRRESEIKDAADKLQAAMQRWADTGCFAALGEAHRHLAVMEGLIHARSPEQVQRMERARGLVH